MRSGDISAVRSLRLFAGMADDSFFRLSQAASLQRFPAGAILIEEGTPVDFLYVIMEGLLELFAHNNGHEATLALVEPVATFNLDAAIRDTVYLMSARTLQSSQLLMIPAATVRDVICHDPAFSKVILAELAEAFRTTIKALKTQKLRSTVERLANWLLVAHEDQGSQGAVALGIDKRTLAALLGMTPENLSRAFGTLKSYGIEVRGRNITLKHIDDLRRFAKPNPLIDDRTV